MKIFFSVGEPSGDLHGANLIAELRRQDPSLEFVGFGGPRMRSAGCSLLADLTELAVMWIWRVLMNIHRFAGYLWQANCYFRTQRPDAVVLIDYPGFNWWIARRARAHGIPVFYYGTPQIWAWASWRVKKMRRFVNHVLCKLPFEVDWFRARGCQATYVGHPYFDELVSFRPDSEFIAIQQLDKRPIVVILPGSRNQEVLGNLKWFLMAAQKVRAQVRDVRFVVASFNERQGSTARQLITESQMDVEVFVGKTPELMSIATCCMACSGSVSLELLFHAKPTVILYWMKPFFYWIATRFFVQVRFITLVNLLASDRPFVDAARPRNQEYPAISEMLMPEYATCQDKTEHIAAHVVGWLTRPEERERCEARLRELRAKYAHPGASLRAADYIRQVLGAPPKIARAA